MYTIRSRVANNGLEVVYEYFQPLTLSPINWTLNAKPRPYHNYTSTVSTEHQYGVIHSDMDITSLTNGTRVYKCIGDFDHLIRDP